MQTENFDFTVSTAYGSTLPTPVKVKGNYEAFETYEELVSKNEIPSNDDILNFVNAKRKAAARAKATNDALTAAGVSKPNLKDSEELQISTMAKVFIARGDSEDTARQKAKAALGL